MDNLPTTCPQCGSPLRLQLIGTTARADLHCPHSYCRQVYVIRLADRPKEDDREPPTTPEEV